MFLRHSPHRLPTAAEARRTGRARAANGYAALAALAFLLFAAGVVFGVQTMLTK